MTSRNDEKPDGFVSRQTSSKLSSTDEEKSSAAATVPNLVLSQTEQADRETKRRATQVIRQAGEASIEKDADRGGPSFEPTQQPITTGSVSASRAYASSSSISPPTNRSSISSTRRQRVSRNVRRPQPGAVSVLPPQHRLSRASTASDSSQSRRSMKGPSDSYQSLSPGAVSVNPPQQRLSTASAASNTSQSLRSMKNARNSDLTISPLSSLSPRQRLERKIRGDIGSQLSPPQLDVENDKSKPLVVTTSPRQRMSISPKQQASISPRQRVSTSPRQRLESKVRLNAGSQLPPPQLDMEEGEATKSKNRAASVNVKSDSGIGQFPALPSEASESTNPAMQSNNPAMVADRTATSAPVPTMSTVDQALSAELVTAEVLDEEEERERIRRQAEEDAQQRLLASALTAEATIYIDNDDGDNGDDRNNRDKRVLLFVLLLVSVLLIGIAVAVTVVLTRPNSSSSVSVRFNDDCPDAFGPLNVTAVPGGIGNIIQGSNIRATPDNYTCDAAAEEGGFGLWYFLEGSGERVYASTCQGTSFDTQLLVFSSSSQSCDEELQCIGGSDQYPSDVCGDNNAIGWRTEENVNYYLLVRGFRASNTGSFTLTVDSLDDNGSCASAVSMDMKSSKQVVFGSTRDLSLSIESEASSCKTSPVRNDSPNAWYRLEEGDGKIRCASVSSEASAFSAELAVFTGSSCDDLACLATASPQLDEVAWITEPGMPYYIAVSGVEAEEAGDFFLSVRTDVPSNDLCETATELSSFIDGPIVVRGTTLNACKDYSSVLECSGRRASQAPGVWYVLKNATGDVLRASTCDTMGDFVSQIFIYAAHEDNNTTDNCNSLECVELSEELCGDQTSVTWTSTPNTNYYIFVNAFKSGFVGNFTLTVNEVPPAVGDICETANFVNPDANVRKGSTIGATVDVVPVCSAQLYENEIDQSYQGVWYSFEGSGTELLASLCHPGTNYGARVSVYTGNCGELECVEPTSASACDAQGMKVSWFSIENQQYHVLVHGSATLPSTGSFVLTIGDV